MPPPEDDRGLKPIAYLRVSDVPGAGHLELVGYKEGRRLTKEWCWLSTIVSAFFGLVAAATSGVAYVFGFFIILSAFFLSAAGFAFWRLAAGPKSWHFLPEGANEATALLEDATAKSIRQWNADVEKWNKALVQLEVDAGLWRMRRDDPSARPDGWSEESQVWDGGALLSRGKGLTLGRKQLRARQRMIKHAIGALQARLRREELASQMADPEPEDG
jgi:hypothetical protein